MEAVSEVRGRLWPGTRKPLSGAALAGINEGIDCCWSGFQRSGPLYSGSEAMARDPLRRGAHLKEMRLPGRGCRLGLAITEYAMEDYAYRAALSTLPGAAAQLSRYLR